MNTVSDEAGSVQLYWPDADGDAMRRSSLLVAAIMLAVACGEPVANTATTSETVNTAVTLPQTTTTTPRMTSSTIGVATTIPVDADDMSPEELVELYKSLGAIVVRPSLVPGEAIDPPADFPTVDDLAVVAGGFITGHLRARITSYRGPRGNPVELFAGGMMLEDALGTMVTITYFDGVTVWDWSGGPREVRVLDSGFMTLGPDGKWTESGSLTSPVAGPFPEQSDVQQVAAYVLASENEVVGYERIADVDTVRISLRVEGAGVDVWVNADGLVMRQIYDTADPKDPATLSFIWNVETLTAQLTGPLPPGI